MGDITHQAPMTMGFIRQEYWSGLPFPSPGDLPDPGMEPRSPALQPDSLLFEPPVKQSVLKMLPTLEVFYGLGQETLGSLDLCR